MWVCVNIAMITIMQRVMLPLRTNWYPKWYCECDVVYSAQRISNDPKQLFTLILGVKRTNFNICTKNVFQNDRKAVYRPKTAKQHENANRT